MMANLFAFCRLGDSMDNNKKLTTASPGAGSKDIKPTKDSKYSITRRDFLKATGAFVLVAGTGGCALIQADESPTSTLSPASPTSTKMQNSSMVEPIPESSAAPKPQQTQESPRAQVAFVKTTDRAEGVRRALALLGINPAEDKSVILKPNFNSTDPVPGSTHIDILRTLVESLKEMGARAITVADRSGMGNTRRVMKRKGVLDLADELGFDIQVLDELDAADWIQVQPPDSHWTRGFLFPRPFLEADIIIQTCCLKTHRYGGHFTISLKNSVGMVAKFGEDGYNYMQELHSSPNQRKMIAEINAAYNPALVVVDAVEAFVTGGPDTGKRVQSELVLAGTDRIALDAVGVAILRYFGTTPEVERGRIFEQEQIARAVSLGLGVSRAEEIELLTDDTASADYAAQIQAVLLS
jgi:uncharacterized protein (DUF362 family)